MAAPIEEQVSGVENMMYMSSQCTNDGAYNLTVTFRLGMDTDMAQVLVQNRVSLALPVIPPLVQNEGISVKKMSPNTLMIVNLISPDGQYDSTFLSNYATIYIKDELGRLPGVAGITYLGQRDYSLRAWLDPQKLASLNLSAMDVVNAISQQNMQVAAGQIGQQPVPKGQQFQLTINTLGRLVEPEQFGDIILKAGGQSQRGDAVVRRLERRERSRPGGQSSEMVRAARPTRAARAARGPVAAGPRDRPVRDVARVELGSRQYDQSCTLDGQPSVAVSIYQLPGSNALDTADGVYAKMKELKTRFPDGLDYEIVYDTTPFIRESVDEVLKTLRDAVILVGIVVLVFLQDWKAMILPMIDVPVSLIGTFAVMAAMGFSLNNLTLFGLVLAIGIVVDDAIVVLENIERLIATGLDSRTATIKAMEEITGPILAITLVLSLGVRAVLFPGWDHRSVLSPVRRDDRRVDDYLGGQRPDHDPVSGGSDLQDRGGQPRSRAQARSVAVVDFRLGRGTCWPTGTGRICWPGGSVCPPAAAEPSRRLRLDVVGNRRGLFWSRRGGRRSDRLACHPAGERCSGLAFRGFNRVFDRMTAVYGRVVGGCCDSARSCSCSMPAFWC